MQWLAIRNWQWPTERILQTASLRTTWEVAQELNTDHSVIIRHLKQIEKMKRLIKWCLMSWPPPKKNHHFEVTFSLTLCSNEQFLFRVVTRKRKCIQQLATSSSVVGPRSSKALPKVKLAPKKESWSLLGGLLLVRSTIAFWIPVKPLHLRSMFSKSMRCTENCYICSWQWSTDGPNSSPRKCLIAHHTTIASKVESIGLQSYASATISPDLSLMGYHFFKHLDNFLQGKCFHISRKQKMLTESSSNLKTQIFCYKNKQTYFLLAKICWL